MKNAAVIDGLAKPKGRFPHYRRAGDFIYVSGISSRRNDDSFEGVAVDGDGKKTLDIQAQTRAVIENIANVLKAAGSSLDDVVEACAYLVNMADFKGYNEVYGEFFSDIHAARTTVAVRELPHPDILIEIKAVAYAPL